LENDSLLRHIACSQGGKLRTTQQTWAETLQESGLIPKDYIVADLYISRSV
jgi:hypothetical protein